VPEPQPLQRETRILSSEDGGQFALTRVWSESVETRLPIIFLSGSFTGRKFWLADKDIGLAAWLATQGFPGWIVERRGIGASPKPNDGSRAGIEEHLQHDLPQVQREIEACHQQAAFVIGHSWGGVIGSRAVAETLNPSRIAGLVLFATQFEVGKPWMMPPLSWIPLIVAKLRGDFPGPWSGLGPETEPYPALYDSMTWTPRARRNMKLAAPMASIEAPVLAISSVGDTVDPAAGCQKFIDRFASTDKTFKLLGQEFGQLEDYNHPGMVISKNAQAEVWPLVADWLIEHSNK